MNIYSTVYYYYSTALRSDPRGVAVTSDDDTVPRVLFSSTSRHDNNTFSIHSRSSLLVLHTFMVAYKLHSLSTLDTELTAARKLLRLSGRYPNKPARDYQIISRVFFVYCIGTLIYLYAFSRIIIPVTKCAFDWFPLSHSFY